MVTASRDFENMLSQVERVLSRYIVRSVQGDTHAAADIYQECVLFAFKNFELLRCKECFPKWIFMIAKYKCLEYFRSKRRERTLFDRLARLAVIHDSFEDRALDNLLFNERLMQIRSVQENEAAILNLVFRHNCTLLDVSMLLGVNKNTIASRYYRLLKKIRSTWIGDDQ